MSKLRLSLISILCVSIAAHGHEGHANPKSVEACIEREIASPCSYVMNENLLYKGTCRSIAEKMMCVRNQPIEEVLDLVQQSKKQMQRTSVAKLLIN